MQKNAYFKGLTIPFLLLLPQLAITVVFFYWPASQAVWQSFLLQDAFGTSTEFVWFENYQALFADPGYLKAFINTLVRRSMKRCISFSCRVSESRSSSTRVRAIQPWASRSQSGRLAI